MKSIIYLIFGVKFQFLRFLSKFFDKNEGKLSLHIIFNIFSNIV